MLKARKRNSPEHTQILKPKQYHWKYHEKYAEAAQEQ